MKFFASLLAALILLSSVPAAEAAEPRKELVQQLSAITAYLNDFLETYPTLTSAQEQKVIEDATGWIVASQAKDGHFNYEYAPFEGAYSDDDNMVRQAGTFAALADVYSRQTEKDPAVAEALQDAIAYFESVTERVDNEHGEFWCIRRTAEAARCDLGSTALTMVGLLRYLEAEPAQARDYETLLDNYVAYLIAAKRPEAGFSNRYYFEDGFSDDESPFFNGEAMLVLVRYYQYEADEDVKAMLEEMFVYLSEKEYESPLYLWIMAALKDMQRLWPNEAYVTYARDFTDVRLNSAALHRGTDHNYCAPVEGLASAYSVLEGEVAPTFLKRLYDELEFWLGKTTLLQLSHDNPYRLVGTGGELELVTQTEPEVAHGGFLTGETELVQRIDFTQHCVSAYIQKFEDIDGNSL